jgi:hypothetical protein
MKIALFLLIAVVCDLLAHLSFLLANAITTVAERVGT